MANQKSIHGLRSIRVPRDNYKIQDYTSTAYPKRYCKQPSHWRRSTQAEPSDFIINLSKGHVAFMFSNVLRWQELLSFIIFLLTKRSTWAPFPDPFPWPFPWSSLYTVGYKLDLVPVAAIVALLHCVLCGCEACGPRTRSSTGNRPVALLRNGRGKRPPGTNKLYF